MKYLNSYKLFEFDDDWRRKTDDESLLKLSLEIDDILYDISDEGFPYVQPSLINNKNKSIMVEIVGDPDGKIDTNIPFKINKNIKESLERIIIITEEIGYEYNIIAYSNMKSMKIIFKNNKWYLGKCYSDNRFDILGIEVDFITITITK